MKKLLKGVVNQSAKLMGILFPYSLVVRLTELKVVLYSQWISSQFKTFGKSSTIFFPLDLRGGKFISIGDNVGMGKRGTLAAWTKYRTTGDSFEPFISIGDNCSIGNDFHITAINGISIGNNVLIGAKVLITDNDHGKSDLENFALPPIDRHLVSKGSVTIEDCVWIGEKVTILSNVTIGRSAIIAANSVVTKDVPSNSIVAGVPAKVKKVINT